MIILCRCGGRNCTILLSTLVTPKMTCFSGVWGNDFSPAVWLLVVHEYWKCVYTLSTAAFGRRKLLKTPLAVRVLFPVTALWWFTKICCHGDKNISEYRCGPKAHIIHKKKTLLFIFGVTNFRMKKWCHHSSTCFVFLNYHYCTMEKNDHIYLSNINNNIPCWAFHRFIVGLAVNLLMDMEYILPIATQQSRSMHTQLLYYVYMYLLTRA